MTWREDCEYQQSISISREAGVLLGRDGGSRSALATVRLAFCRPVPS